MSNTDQKLSSLSPENSGCVFWPGKPGAGGYARAWIDGRSRRLAKYVLEKKLGRPLIEGMITRHTCDNPMCVCENHLVEGTPKQNTADMFERGRSGWQRGTNSPPLVQGSSHGAAKIDEEAVLDIRSRYSNGGITQKQLAEEYGIAQCTVSEIVRGLIWAHV